MAVDPIGAVIEGVGVGLGVLGNLSAAAAAKRAAAVTAGTISQTSELNASLIEQGSELNATTHDFQAAALEGQSRDAVQRGKEQEDLFRKQLNGVIGSQRASYASQDVDISSGSPLEVQQDTAFQGELDALTIRANSAREAWGFSVAAKGERLTSDATRRLGVLQARNTRQVGHAEANNARVTGNAIASAHQWGAASTIATGAADVYRVSKYGR